jgi:2-polyprenyl-6-methoxyphenol hydroxylase-like FAD-dependent oxidoreductase/protein-S-isoprenylcysteine O-methyltransferase Ste14
MSSTVSSGQVQSLSYTSAQRGVALLYGLVCHVLFASSVVAMFIGLYTGLSSGLGPLHGWSGLLMNGFLIGQFAISHSLLLSDRGRKFMTRLAPLGLGRDLSTTIFAAVASVQLLATFVLWSPSHVLWAAPTGWVKEALTLGYIVSWVLLVKSMHDAGMGVQIGVLGWRSVWRNQRPNYQPFARSGMFRYSRQPIYSSFALILWTAPVWTPDHLFMAVLWTSYCVVAPIWKERRYQRFYGEAFARYQKSVPYWFPSKPRAIMTQDSTAPATDCDVAIVGAGPVGLLLANLLGAKGLRVQVLEKRIEPLTHSQAIGITPPSLDILREVGLDEAFVSRGVKIRDVFVHGDEGSLGCCSFRELPGDHPYILSLPQMENIRLLEQNLEQFPNVTLHRGVEVRHVTQEAGQVTLQHAGCTTARYVIACDGWRSGLRQMLKIRTQSRAYACHFLMGDFTDRTALGEEAHLFFTADGAVESFPLPEGKRRWIVQTSEHLEDASPGLLSQIVKTRAGFDLPLADQLNQSAFTPRRLDCEVLHDGRVLLCGDAAHAMSPIGGQGMNTGFADAQHLARALTAILQEGQAPEAWLRDYDQKRRRVSATAATRAAWGMGIGTWTGPAKTTVRDLLLPLVLKGKAGELLARHYAMR